MMKVTQISRCSRVLCPNHGNAGWYETLEELATTHLTSEEAKFVCQGFLEADDVKRLSYHEQIVRAAL
jgi:hypothetical protein